MLQLVRFPIIVGVEEGDPFSAGQIDATIAGAGRAAVGLTMQTHALAVAGQGGGQVVRTAIVDDENFVRQSSLRQ